ncbi:TIGR02587 family membrane protein [Ramlibacter sp. AW1]|uniref:TIGR02587 family membrane protein n=2 Tax=Ramlibacter aurantiacus TaxID=2801330 RepID=A0A936ZL34_9BURK|nr:TIGR02587 family membrane protein [Ramlibacter aurantiacus]MBL0422188.1 TIGR02587 family membrane protein [Ramlibacter aurantiacus]
MSPTAAFGVGLARAGAGAVIFGLPMFMTQEMWHLPVYMPEWKLIALLALFFPFLVALSWHAGFENTFSWRDDVVDALVAYAVGFAISGAMLWLLGVIDERTSLRAGVGQVALQAVPASIGALLAQSQLGERDPARSTRGGVNHWGSDLFIMAVGALFLCFNMAPTEEMALIAMQVGEPLAIALIALSLAVMHAFVYGVAFRGRPRPARGLAGWRLFLHSTLSGYLVALAISAGMLWIFGRLDGLSVSAGIQAVVVLGLPAAVGAAAARLIL